VDFVQHHGASLQWLTLALFAYVITAFLAHPHWPAVVRATFIHHIKWTKDYPAVLVGILGTTISPYLFFWQAAQEVEEESKDVITGMLLSNLVMYFLILTTGATLHVHGVTQIERARQTAEALLPLAGKGAYLLFTLGLVGTGMLAVPVLAGSSAYAIAEAAKWRPASLGVKPERARKFYAVIAVAIVVGLALDFAGFNALKMLLWSAILNGLFAPPLVVMVVLLTSDRKVMGSRANSSANMRRSHARLGSRPIGVAAISCRIKVGPKGFAIFSSLELWRPSSALPIIR
jgi:Mn2+/Fe2+ NRAMP family transporter